MTTWMEKQKAEFKAGFKEGYHFGNKYKIFIAGLTLVLIACVVFLTYPVNAGCIENTNTIFPTNPSGAYDLPRLPHTFGGYVFTSECVTITALTDYGNSSIVACGSFGLGTFDEKLTVQNVPEGTIIRFLVNGEPVKVCVNGECYPFWNYHTGHHTVISLYPPKCCP